MPVLFLTRLQVKNQQTKADGNWAIAKVNLLKIATIASRANSQKKKPKSLANGWTRPG